MARREGGSRAQECQADGMLTRVWNSVLDALAVMFPVQCAGCGSPDRVLCAPCREALRGAQHAHALADGTPVWSALRYEGIARAVILEFKERGRADLATPLARALLSVLESAAAAARVPVEVCAVPSRRDAHRRRGYRPVDLLLRGCGIRAARVLVFAERTSQQKSLGIAGREVNLKGSLCARAPLPGRYFIVVDDIVTSGATLVEAARAIHAAGGVVVSAATLAFTPKRAATRTDSWRS